MNEAQLMRQHTLFQKSWPGHTCNHGGSSKPTTAKPVTQRSGYHRDTKPKLEGGMTVTNYTGMKPPNHVANHTQSNHILPPLLKGRSSPAIVMPPRSLARAQSHRKMKTMPSQRVKPWREAVPPLSDNTNKRIELHYNKSVPKEKWLEYKPRQYVSNPKYGSIYEVRKDVTDSKEIVPPPSSWLWEEEYRIWRLDEKRPPPRSFTKRGFSHRKLGKIAVDKPHAELFAAYHSELLDKQKRQVCCIVIQRHVRGWLVRKNMKDLKRRTLRGLGMSWPTFVTDYKETVTRIQSRYGVMKTECQFDIKQVQGFVERKENCERMYEKMVRYGKMEKSDLPEFFRKSGLHPTDEEISKAFNTIYRGSLNTAEVVFVLDCSASLGPINFQNQINFVKDVVQGFDIASDRVRIGIVPDNSIQSFDLTQFNSKDEVVEAVDKLEYRTGISRTDLALKMMRQLFKYARPGVKKIALVCTDGKSSEPGLTLREAKIAREENIEIFAIGVGYTVQTHELEAMTGDKHHVRTCSDLSTLGELKDLVKNRICLACCALCHHILPRIESEGLYLSEVLDITWTIAPPPATRLETDINQLSPTLYYGKDQTDVGNVNENGPSLKDVCRPLTRSEVMEIVLMVYPPEAAGFEKRKSRWIRPIVDGVEAWSLLDDKIIKKTDYKKCMRLVIQSKLERDGFMDIPTDLRLGVERVSNLEEALERVDAYMKLKEEQKQEQEQLERLAKIQQDKVDSPETSEDNPQCMSVQILKIDHLDNADIVTAGDLLEYQHLEETNKKESDETQPTQPEAVANDASNQISHSGLADDRMVKGENTEKEINILFLEDREGDKSPIRDNDTETVNERREESIPTSGDNSENTAQTSQDAAVVRDSPEVISLRDVEKESTPADLNNSLEEDSLEAEGDDLITSEAESLEDGEHFRLSRPPITDSIANASDVMDDDSLEDSEEKGGKMGDEYDRSTSSLSQDSLTQNPVNSQSKGSQTDRATPVKPHNDDVSYIS